MTTGHDIDDEAARWHGGQDRDDYDWDGFTRWLEADPAHAPAYHAIALLDRTIDDGRHALRPSAPRASRRPWRLAAAGAAVAAVVAGTLPLLHAPPAAPLAWRTGAGEIRMVALPGGARATLAPGSTLVAVAHTPRHVRLTGTAFFDVRHDAAAPFAVEAGGFTVEDRGTRFDVSAEGGALRVGVERGQVSVSADRLAQPVLLDAGRSLLADPARGLVEVAARPAAAVGGWRSGRLVYDRAPLDLVAADVSRYAGIRVVVDPGVATRRFSGVIAITGNGSAIDTLQQLTGLDARREGSMVHLGAPRRR